MDHTRSTLTPQDLDPRAMYCVVSDVQMRESTVVPGELIQREETEPTRMFRRFQPTEPIWEHYVRVDFGRFVLAVWRDPSRPELRVVDGGDEAFVAETITDPEALPERPVDAMIDAPWHETAIKRAAECLVESLYVQP